MGGHPTRMHANTVLLFLTNNIGCPSKVRKRKKMKEHSGHHMLKM